MSSRFLLLFSLLLSPVFLLGCATVSEHELAPPVIIFSDNPAMLGEAISIRIESLPANQEFIVQASRAGTWNPNQLYQSQARFLSDRNGVIKLAHDAPLEAEWSTADVNGLFWAMRNTNQPTPEGLATNEIRVQLLDSSRNELASSTLRLQASSLTLVESALGNGFPGAFVLRPEGNEPLPAIIILGGSEGGDSGARASAPLWAARGYAAVGYPYYSPAWGDQPQAVPGLPRAFADIPIEKLSAVRAALHQRGDIQMNRIGLYGVSKGAEFVLTAASRIEGFAAVAAIVPSDVIWEGWGPGTSTGEHSSFSWQGEPLPFVPYLDMGRAIGQVPAEERVAMRIPHAEGRQAFPDTVEPARIRVEAIDEPVFLLGGGRDQVWDSGLMATNIAKTRTDAGLITETLIFEYAGHGLSGPPQNPASRSSAQAKTAAWPALIAFFERYLKPSAE